MRTFTKLTVVSLMVAGLSQGQVYDDSQRPQVCDRNMQTCDTLCANRDSQAKANTCDPDTFNFACTCADNYTPNPKNVTFPASLATCQIEGSQCNDKCGSDVTCAQKCVEQYVCNGAGDSNDNKTALPSPTGSSTKSASSTPSIFDGTSDATRPLHVTSTSLLALASFLLVTNVH